MTLDDIKDFARRADEEIGRYTTDVTLNPERMLNDEYAVANLHWDSIKYGPDHLNQVPDDKRGVYAFTVGVPSTVLPPHGYVLYIGIAGRRSNRSLKSRYGDYLNPKKVLKRPKIAMMIGTWQPVLRFMFAPVDDALTSSDLERLEVQLNTALIPPYSQQDIDAEIATYRKAWQ